MCKRLLLSLALIVAAPFASAQGGAKPTVPAPAPGPKVLMHTSLGDLTIELYPEKAPKTVDNFLQYVNSGFYAGTVFHRVIPGMLVQGGGFTKDLQLKRTRAPIPSEANNGLSNVKYTVAIARIMQDPNSAAAQFFINVTDNRRLDYVNSPGNTNGLATGYTVFGKVIKGQDVVDKIAASPTGPSGPLPSDVPTTPITIDKIDVIDQP